MYPVDIGILASSYNPHVWSVDRKDEVRTLISSPQIDSSGNVFVTYSDRIIKVGTNLKVAGEYVLGTTISSAVLDNSNNLILLKLVTSYNQFQLTKIDPSNNILWQRMYTLNIATSEARFQFWSNILDVDPHNNIYVSWSGGATFDSVSGVTTKTPPVIAKISSAGTFNSAYSFGTSYHEVHNVQVNTSSIYVVRGGSDSGRPAVVTKINSGGASGSLGSVVYSRTFGASVNMDSINGATIAISTLDTAYIAFPNYNNTADTDGSIDIVQLSTDGAVMYPSASISVGSNDDNAKFFNSSITLYNDGFLIHSRNDDFSTNSIALPGTGILTSGYRPAYVLYAFDYNFNPIYTREFVQGGNYSVNNGVQAQTNIKVKNNNLFIYNYNKMLVAKSDNFPIYGRSKNSILTTSPTLYIQTPSSTTVRATKSLSNAYSNSAYSDAITAVTLTSTQNISFAYTVATTSVALIQYPSSILVTGL